MVQFLSIFFFLGFLQFLLGFSKVPVFLCHPVYLTAERKHVTYLVELSTELIKYVVSGNE